MFPSLEYERTEEHSWAIPPNWGKPLLRPEAGPLAHAFAHNPPAVSL